MTIDPKAVAGAGVAVAAIGGGVAYAVSNTSSNQETNSLNGDELYENMKNKLKDAGFEITNESDSYCEQKLNSEYSSDSFREAVVACYKNKTLKDRAQKLELPILDVSKLVDSTVSDQDWKDKWTSKSTDIKTLDTSSSGTSTWSSIDNAREKVKAFCEPSQSITSATNDSDWQKYLKICIKEDSNSSTKLAEALKKDFWTNKEPTVAEEPTES